MSLRTWWESRAAETPTDYTSLRIAESVERVSGEQGARGTAAFKSCKNLIGRSASMAALEGEFSESLAPHLSDIARNLADCGESTFELRLGLDGLALLPCKISSVTGGAEPTSWHYSLIRSGPTENLLIERPAAAVLAFRVNAEPGAPYRGVGALEATNTTGALLSGLEEQLRREARLKPARIVTAGGNTNQAGQVESRVARGGIISILQALGTVSTNDPTGLRAGVLKNETTAALVELYEQLERAVCAAMGVPGGLILSDGDGAAARENFRFFAASTIAPILEVVKTEWQAKVGPLKFNLDALRASDETARARALGSRANALLTLVKGGMTLDEALAVVDID